MGLLLACNADSTELTDPGSGSDGAESCAEEETWFEPGCAPPDDVEQAEGCFEVCGDQWPTEECGAGFECEPRWYFPCLNNVCQECGSQIFLCVEST